MVVYPITYVLKLKKIAISRTGNLYFPGVYTKGNPLPPELRTEQYCEVVEAIEDPNGTVEEEAPKALEGKEVTKEPEEPFTSEVPRKSIKVSNTEPPLEGLNINEATVEEIAGLSGIGVKTAERVVELRSLAPFVGYEDLASRIKLPFDRDWKNYNLTF